MFRELNYLRNRVIELERQLEKERAENRRTERWMTNMLMRRAGSIPVPPPQPERPKVSDESRLISESDFAKAEAIRAEGIRVGAQRDEIERAIKEQTGWDESELAAAIKATSIQ